MDNFSILHISDLHYCQENQHDINVIIKALLNDLKQFVAEGLTPDIVVFSGDLINIGDYGFSQNRNDFDLALNKFILPLLSCVNLNLNNLYICPGNHDVQRNKINQYFDSGLNSELIDKPSLNTFLDSYESNSLAFERMNNFELFITSLSITNFTSRNVFSSTHIINKAERKIGIACINSAWKAKGGVDDYGKLLIGERIVQNCIANIGDCELRVAVMHHPWEYLSEFNRFEIKRLIYGSFHLLLNGHSHKPDISNIQAFNENRIVVISGGALYKNRDYFNGYSLINYSFSDNCLTVNLREYNDRSRQFIPALAYENVNGIIKYTLMDSGLIDSKINLPLIDKIKDNVLNQVNSILLPATIDSSIAPKKLEELFVEPPLYNYPEYYIKDLLKQHNTNIDDNVKISVDSIIHSDKNFIIIGNHESGKSTLLIYIYTKMLSPTIITKSKIPLFIDFNILPKGKNAIEKAITNHLIDLDIQCKIDNFLTLNNWILFVDNLDTTNNKGVQELINFINTYPKNQYIMTIDEDILQEIRDNLPIELPLEYEKVYIHSFSRKEIRSLTDNWFRNSSQQINSGDLADEILKQISAVNMSKSPFEISMILLSIEMQKNYNLLNKSSLMENIIEILLEKLYPYAQLPGGLDYRNIEDFLSYFAQHFVDNDIHNIAIIKSYDIAEEYFNNRGIMLFGGAQQFFEYLINHGILFKNREFIEFRFDGFFEYFIAKQMIENPCFYNDILSENKYLNFINSIDYLTGLERKNQKLLDILSDRLKESLHELLECLNIDENELGFVCEIDSYKSDTDIKNIDEREILINRIKKLKLTEDEKDEISDIVYKNSIAMEAIETSERNDIIDKDKDKDIDKDKDKDNYRFIERKIFKNIFLFSNVVRNCELIDDKEYKKEKVNQCLMSYLYFIAITAMVIETEIDESSNENIQKHSDEFNLSSTDITPEMAKQIIKTTLRNFNFGFLISILSGELGTPKLKMIFDEEMENPEIKLPMQFLFTMMYLDLKLPGYLDKINLILDQVLGIDLFRDVFLVQLFMHYSTSKLSIQEQHKIESILADIIIMMKNLSKREKSQIIQDISKSKIKLMGQELLSK